MEDNQLATIIDTDNKIFSKLIQLEVLMNSITARLEALEKMCTSNNVATKRTIKIAPTSGGTQDVDEIASISSTGSKHKQPAVTTNTEEKIINALTFFKKYVMFKNYDNLRSKYSTQEMINTAKAGIKKPEGSEAYWISVGNAIWKVLDKDQKKDVREDFNKWKKTHQIGGDVSQLNEDGDDEDD
jgi:hypothetical protein